MEANGNAEDQYDEIGRLQNQVGQRATTRQRDIGNGERHDFEIHGQYSHLSHSDDGQEFIAEHDGNKYR